MGTLRLRFPRAVLLTLLCACGDSSGGGGSTDFGPDGPFVPEPETAVPDAPGTGRTFYVSSSGGSDSNNGMSEATAFASVSAVNALSLLPGDKVLFKCGDTFRGQPLVLLSSGSDVDYIQIGSYPSGCANRPRLWGSQPISGWTGYQANIWVADLGTGANAGKFPNGINQLFVDGGRVMMGRTPNLDAPDGGYLTIDSQPTNRSITDSAMPNVDWTGAALHIKGMRWFILNRRVTGRSGTTVTVGADLDCWGGNCTGWGYFFNDHLSTLDRDGEWYYDDATHRVYVYRSAGAPTDAEGSVVVRNDVRDSGGIVLGEDLGKNVAYIAIDNLEIARWYMHGITTPVNQKNDEPHHILVRRNVVRDVDADGIHFATWAFDLGSESGWRGGHDLEFVENTIEDANHYGISAYSHDTRFLRNQIRRIGMISELIASGLGCAEDAGGGFCTEPGDGIHLTIDKTAYTGFNNLVRENVLEDIGYCGIDSFHRDSQFSYNVVRRACTTKGDCGAIRLFGGDDFGSTRLRHVLLAHNVLVDTIGNTDGTAPEYRTRFGFGLYIDHHAVDVQTRGNIVLGSTADGILFQDSTGTIEDSVVVGNGTDSNNAGQIDLYGDATVSTISGTILATLSNGASTLLFHTPGVISASDQNVFLHASKATHIWLQSGPVGLSGWQSMGHDAMSSEVVAPSVAQTMVLYNDTPAAKTVSVPSNFRSPTGATLPSSITLQPFTAQVLVPATAFP